MSSYPLRTIYYLQLLNIYSASPCAVLWHNGEAAVMSRIIIISWRDMAPLLRHHQPCQYLYHHHPTVRHFALTLHTQSTHLFEQLFMDFCKWYMIKVRDKATVFWIFRDLECRFVSTDGSGCVPPRDLCQSDDDGEIVLEENWNSLTDIWPWIILYYW